MAGLCLEYGPIKVGGNGEVVTRLEERQHD